MYRGKDEQRPAGMAATVWPVHHLTYHEQYWKKGYIIAMDNWYTSMQTGKLLLSEPRKIGFVGTMKVKKRGLPKECIIKKDKGPQKSPRGAISSRKITTHDGITVYFTGFMDKKPVHVFSSWPTKYDYCNRNSKDGQGNFQRIQITRPTVMAAYNQSMGCTDKMDQLCSYYDDRQRVLKWQMRIIFHFLRVSAMNAMILFKDKKSATTDSESSLLQVIMDVVRECFFQTMKWMRIQ